MKFSSLLQLTLSLIAFGCASKPSSAFDQLLEQEGLASGIQIKESSSSSGKILKHQKCVSGNEVPRELRDQCWEQTCERQGNEKRCTEGGNALVKKFIDEHDARIAQEKKDLEDRIASSKKSCLAGDLKLCEAWLQDLGSDDEDGLGIICKEKKTFSCKSTFAPLKVDEFLPECRLQTEELRCEEGNNGEYIETVVTLNKKRQR